MDGTAQARTNNSRARKALVLAATLATGSPAVASDFVWNFNENIPSERSERLRSASAADNVLDQRWGGVTDDYVLGPDGAVRAYSGDQEDVVDEDLHTHNGNIQNGILTVADSPGAVAECGPSPLDRQEVRRLVEAAAVRHGVDPAFAAGVAWAESDFDRNRNSPKGARGVMQLMPATAEQFGVIDVCDPADNIEGGITYLRVLFEQFENPLLVAAAYNAGEGRVLEHGGIPPFHETVGFVAKVLNYQLGLSMPSTVRTAAGASTPTAGVNDPDAGVITARAHGEFVGGVMHFNWRDER